MTVCAVQQEVHSLVDFPQTLATDGRVLIKMDFITRLRGYHPIIIRLCVRSRAENGHALRKRACKYYIKH